MNVDHATGEIAGNVLRKIRQSALGDESFGQFRIHAVEAENHGTFDLRVSIGLASPQQAKQLPKRPDQKGVHGIEQGDEKSPEG